MTWFTRKRRWPTIDLYSKDGPGDIKALSASDLKRLMETADARGWSAIGSPEWLAQHRDQFREATLVIFGTEGLTTYRCIATIVLMNGTGGRFTLDVSMRDFKMLPDLTDQALVTMAHRSLSAFPPIDLELNREGDVDQGCIAWENSVWKKWGDS